MFAEFSSTFARAFAPRHVPPHFCAGLELASSSLELHPLGPFSRGLYARQSGAEPGPLALLTRIQHSRREYSRGLSDYHLNSDRWDLESISFDFWSEVVAPILSGKVSKVDPISLRGLSLRRGVSLPVLEIPKGAYSQQELMRFRNNEDPDFELASFDGLLPVPYGADLVIHKSLVSGASLAHSFFEQPRFTKCLKNFFNSNMRLPAPGRMHRMKMQVSGQVYAVLIQELEHLYIRSLRKEVGVVECTIPHLNNVPVDEDHDSWDGETHLKYEFQRQELEDGTWDHTLLLWDREDEGTVDYLYRKDHHCATGCMEKYALHTPNWNHYQPAEYTKAVCLQWAHTLTTFEYEEDGKIFQMVACGPIVHPQHVDPVDSGYYSGSHDTLSQVATFEFGLADDEVSTIGGLDDISVTDSEESLSDKEFRRGLRKLTLPIPEKTELRRKVYSWLDLVHVLNAGDPNVETAQELNARRPAELHEKRREINLALVGGHRGFGLNEGRVEYRMRGYQPLFDKTAAYMERKALYASWMVETHFKDYYFDKNEKLAWQGHEVNFDVYIPGTLYRAGVEIEEDQEAPLGELESDWEVLASIIDLQDCF